MKTSMIIFIRLDGLAFGKVKTTLDDVEVVPVFYGRGICHFDCQRQVCFCLDDASRSSYQQVLWHMCL